jgi:hypothetical protein
VAYSEFLVLSNAIGIYFPQAVEVPTALSSASSQAASVPIDLQPIRPWEPVHSHRRQTTQEEICIVVGIIGGRASRGDARNQRVGRQLIRRTTEKGDIPNKAV